MKLSDCPEEFSDEFNDITIIEAMKKLLQPYPKILELCMKDNGPKPGILYIAKNAELASLGMLNTVLDESLVIRVVPILHGGLD